MPHAGYGSEGEELEKPKVSSDIVTPFQIVSCAVTSLTKYVLMTCIWLLLLLKKEKYLNSL